MKVVNSAAGLAFVLGETTQRVPKPMIQVGGRARGLLTLEGATKVLYQISVF